MTWTQIDNELNFNPQTMPGTVSNAVLGLWVRLCARTAYQLRSPALDGALNLTVVRSLKGNAQQVTELEAAGMLEPALAADRWVVIEANTLMKFGDTSDSELRKKRARTRHAGGVASGGARRSKTKQLLQANRKAKPRQTMKQKTKQTMKQNRNKRPKQNEAIASKQTKQSVLT